MSAPEYPPVQPQPQPYPAQPVVYAQPQPRNGFGITALVLAIIGLVFGLVPLTGFIALILGALAVLFGLLGFARVRRAVATNKVMTLIGASLGLVAMVVGIVGIVIVFRATDQLVNDLESVGAPTAVNTAPAPAGGDTIAPPPDTIAPPEVPAPDTSAPVPAPGGFTWEDGLQVDVSAPEAVTFSEFACCSPTSEGVVFSVRMVNNTSTVIDPSMALVSLSADGVPATEVYDTDNGYEGLPFNSIPPGGELTFPLAFDATGGELLFEIAPGFDYQSAFFTATL